MVMHDYMSSCQVATKKTIEGPLDLEQEPRRGSSGGGVYYGWAQLAGETITGSDGNCIGG